MLKDSKKENSRGKGAERMFLTINKINWSNTKNSSYEFNLPPN
jgi:hypothetical protein